MGSEVQRKLGTHEASADHANRPDRRQIRRPGR
jgi:hypothetical protein